MDELAICAIFRNEAPYIHEWLCFHAEIGVDRFYLYNNNSTDDTLAEIARFPEKQRIVVTDWPEVPGQISAYRDMMARNGNAALWCAFIDCDEFLVPRAGVAVKDVLYEYWPLCDALYVHWLMFGSSGQLARTPGLVTERFLRRGRFEFGPNMFGKTIIKLARAVEPLGPHVMVPQGRLINEMNLDLDREGKHPALRPSHRLLALHHYFTKSVEEWRTRRALGKADVEPHARHFRRPDEDFVHHDVNDVEDDMARIMMARARRRFS